jgi:AcrR family transcriptional regulator
MPRLIDPRSRADEVVLAIHRLIARGGLGAVTMRASAAESGVSASSLVGQFTGRDRMLAITTWRCGHERLRDIGLRSRSGGGMLTFVPSTEGELRDTRVWLALCELGRSHPDIALKVAALRLEERELIDAILRRQLDEPALDGVVALVEGLGVGVCAPGEPLPPERARDALARHLTGLGIPPDLKW